MTKRISALDEAHGPLSNKTSQKDGMSGNPNTVDPYSRYSYA